jgi:hypothetical protein
MAGSCGSCTACCRVFAIPALNKRAGDWCQHCDVGVGCKIYEARPPTCVDFACLWLQSQERADPRERLPPELRPDRSKVVLCMTTNPAIVGATTMPGAPDAWKRPAMHMLLSAWVARGMGIAIGPPNAKHQLKWTKQGIRQVEMTPPDQDGMQWSVTP